MSPAPIVLLPAGLDLTDPGAAPDPEELRRLGELVLTVGVPALVLSLLLPLRRSGFRYRPRFGWRGYGFGEMSRMTGWTVAALVISQFYGFVSTRVMSPGEAVDGIVSERDVVRRLGSDPAVLDAVVGAIMTADDAPMPQMLSARPNAGSVGGPSSAPVRSAKPLIASARVPKPGRLA